METVYRECGAAHAHGGALATGAQPWRTVTASLSVVFCCFMWLCIRQCHELLAKTRAELSESARAIAEAANLAGSAFFAAAGQEIHASLNPVLGLAATLVVLRLNVQPHMALAESSDQLPHVFNAAMDFSRLVTDRLALEQLAFPPETAADHAVSISGVWTDQPTLGWWMGDHDGDSKGDFLWQSSIGHTAVDLRGDGAADFLWQEVVNLPAIALTDSLSVQSADNVGFDAGPAWQAHGADIFIGDGLVDIAWQDFDAAPAAWLGADLVSDSDIGSDIAFMPVPDWQGTPQSFDLII